MQAPIEHRWSPYTDNGGTCMGVAGEDYAVVVADTRLSEGYRIHTRNSSKVTQLTDKCVITSCGMKSDAITLHRHLKARIVMYEHKHPGSQMLWLLHRCCRPCCTTSVSFPTTPSMC